MFALQGVCGVPVVGEVVRSLVLSCRARCVLLLRVNATGSEFGVSCSRESAALLVYLITDINLFCKRNQS